MLNRNGCFMRTSVLAHDYNWKFCSGLLWCLADSTYEYPRCGSADKRVTANGHIDGKRTNQRNFTRTAPLCEHRITAWAWIRQRGRRSAKHQTVNDERADVFFEEMQAVTAAALKIVKLRCLARRLKNHAPNLRAKNSKSPALQLPLEIGSNCSVLPELRFECRQR